MRVIVADKPDTGKGSTTRSVLAFLGTSTGLVLVCVLLNATGIVKWKDVVELLHGQPKQVAADTSKRDPAGPGDTPPKNPKKKDPVSTGPVTSGNAAPTIKAKPDAITFSPGELTKKLELTLDDEEANRVAVVAVPISVGPIAANGVKVSGSGATRFLDVTIDPEKWGNATVRVTATDPHAIRAEATVRVTVPPPAFSIVEIPDVNVVAGEPIPIVSVTVDDLARKPGKVTITPLVSDAMFPAKDKSYSFDPESKKLRLVPEAGITGTAKITLVAQTDDGREARRSFKVTVAPKPPPQLRVEGKAMVLIGLLSGGLDMDVKGLNSVQGSPALDKGTIVTVKQIQGKRCQIAFVAGGETHIGWVDAKILAAVE